MHRLWIAWLFAIWLDMSLLLLACLLAWPVTSVQRHEHVFETLRSSSAFAYRALPPRHRAGPAQARSSVRSHPPTMLIRSLYLAACRPAAAQPRRAPRVAAALKGGLLPCLETLLRRTATEPDGPHSRLMFEASRGPQSV